MNVGPGGLAERHQLYDMPLETTCLQSYRTAMTSCSGYWQIGKKGGRATYLRSGTASYLLQHLICHRWRHG